MAAMMSSVIIPILITTANLDFRHRKVDECIGLVRVPKPVILPWGSYSFSSLAADCV